MAPGSRFSPEPVARPWSRGHRQGEHESELVAAPAGTWSTPTAFNAADAPGSAAVAGGR